MPEERPAVSECQILRGRSGPTPIGQAGVESMRRAIDMSGLGDVSIETRSGRIVNCRPSACKREVYLFNATEIAIRARPEPATISSTRAMVRGVRKGAIKGFPPRRFLFLAWR